MLSRRGQAVALTLDHKPILFEEARRIIKVMGRYDSWITELINKHVSKLCIPAILFGARHQGGGPNTSNEVLVIRLVNCE